MAGGPQRQDTAAISLQIKYPGDKKFTDVPGYWDKRDGGELDSDETKYYPGAMKDPIVLGGRVTPGNNTLSRLFEGTRDLALLDKLFGAVGKSEAIVTEQTMDIDGNTYGQPIVWQGRLKRVKSPPRDSESTGAALIEVEVSTSGRPQA